MSLISRDAIVFEQCFQTFRCCKACREPCLSDFRMVSVFVRRIATKNHLGFIVAIGIRRIIYTRFYILGRFQLTRWVLLISSQSEPSVTPTRRNCMERKKDV